MSTRIKASSDVVAERVGEEMVLVHLGSNQIYELNPTATRFWELASGGEDLGTVRQAMLDEFDVERDELDREIESFLQTARQGGLIDEMEAA